MNALRRVVAGTVLAAAIATAGVCLSDTGLAGVDVYSTVAVPHYTSIDSGYFNRLQTVREESNPRVAWELFGPGLSGYIESFWIHKTDPEAMFMGLDMGNSHGTWNRGRTWQTIRDCDGDGTDLLPLGYVEFSHQDPDFGLAVARDMIFSTMDRGRSWQLLLDLDPGAGLRHSLMRVDPNDDTAWYVAAGQHWNIKFTAHNKNGLTYSYNQNASSGYIYKSVDQGQSWRKITSIFPQDADFNNLIVDPRDSNIVYASCQHGLYRSTDAGENWALTAGNGLPWHMPRDIDSFYDQETGEFYLYLLEVTRYTPYGLTIETSGGVYRSTDGDNWENLTGNLPIDMSRVHCDLYEELYYKTIGFWLEIDPEAARIAYPEMPTRTFSQFIRLAVDPLNKDRIYLAHNFWNNYGFPPGSIWMTEDGGTSWIAVAREGKYWEDETDKEYWLSRNNPLGVNMVYSHVQREHAGTDARNAGTRFLTINPVGEVYTAFAQQLMRSSDHGASWRQIDDDETMPGSGHWVGRGNSNLPGETVCIETGTPGSYLFGAGEHGLWRNKQDGHIVRPGAIAVKQIEGQSKSNTSSLSISAVAVDPTNTNRIYTLQYRQINAGRLRRSNDRGETWHTVSRPVVFPGVNDVIKQYSLLVDPDAPDTIYFCVPRSDYWPFPSSQWRFNGPDGFSGHGIYKSLDGGESWGMVTNGIPAGKSVYRLAFDPFDSQTIYAALNQTEGLEPGGLFRTVNGGESWSPVLIPPGVESVNDVAVNRFSGDIYIACGTVANDGTTGGAWISRDGGATWSLIFDMPNVRGVTCTPADPDVVAVNVGPARAVGQLNPGVYVTRDGGANWHKINTNLGQPDRITDLKADPYDSDILWCALFGTGFGRADLTFLDHDPEVRTFIAVQDADVKSEDPNGAYGLFPQLKMKASPQRHAYIQFHVSGLKGSITDAKLWVRNHATTPVRGIVTVHAASNGWDEATVTWSIKQDLGESFGARRIDIPGEWHAIDVTPYIAGNGLYTLALFPSGSDGWLYSLEHSGGENAPLLEIKTLHTEIDSAHPGFEFEDIVILTPANEIMLRWWSGSNSTYTLLASTNLLEGIWEPLAKAILATPPLNTLNVPLDGMDVRFFRVQQE